MGNGSLYKRVRRGNEENSLLEFDGKGTATQKTPRYAADIKRFTIDAVSMLVRGELFRGSALAKDKYTLNSFKSALNVNTAGRGDTGTLSPGNRPILVPSNTTAATRRP